MGKSLSKVAVAVSGKISDGHLVGLTRLVSLTQDSTGQVLTTQCEAMRMTGHRFVVVLLILLLLYGVS